MYNISLHELEFLVIDLSRKIKQSNVKFDNIICISRGGLYVGRLLSEILGLPLGVISAKFKGNKYIVNESISFFEPLSGTCLLVDDILEETVTNIEKVIKKKTKINKIYLASIFYKSKNNFKPHFYNNLIKETIWVSFPYQLSSLKEHID